MQVTMRHFVMRHGLCIEKYILVRVLYGNMAYVLFYSCIIRHHKYQNSPKCDTQVVASLLFGSMLPRVL